jgi:hypothetical protein
MWNNMLMEKKDKGFRLRIDEKEYEYAKAQAKYKQLYLSEYLRQMIDKGQRCKCGGNTELGTESTNLDW